MIKLYTTGCSRCVILKKKLDEVDITYKIEDDMKKIVELKEKMGRLSIPTLIVNDEVMNFNQAIAWIRSGDHNGV